MFSNRRQEIYDRIKATSREQFILDEMIRIGYWPNDQGKPTLAEQWLRRHDELRKELASLQEKQRKFADKAALLAEARRLRMQSAKLRREETKQRKEQEKIARAERWQKIQTQDIIYLGAEVSSGLSHKESNVLALGKFHLPIWHQVSDLANAMGRSLGELRFLSYHRLVSETSHYQRFMMPKKSGGERLISAPMPKLKAVQHWILENVLVAVPLHDAAHGFVRDRSIVTNARHHCGKDVVVNMDLKDFFPSVSYRRVRGLFQAMGYSGQVATILGLLCTEAETQEHELDGKTYHIATSERRLPQGAPTSPAITNILCHRLDRRLDGMARKLGFAYTRYADDITFSGSGEAVVHLTKVLWRSRQIIQSENFTLHPEKLRIMRKGQHQEVTGLTVNQKPMVPRENLRRFRALIHQIERDGPSGKHWQHRGAHLLATLHGYACFINMVDPEKGAALVEKAQTIAERYGWKPPQKLPPPVANKTSIASSLWDKLFFWRKKS
jgi:RNA-directed DNA polymerase